MAGVTCTIGATNFTALGSAASAGQRCLMACDPASSQVDIDRYHPPGSTGSLVLRGGETGRHIIVVMRYIDSLANVEANFIADAMAWENTVGGVSIAYAGKTYLRCSLDGGGMKKISEPRSTGRGTCFMDAVAVFICDGGTS